MLVRNTTPFFHAAKVTSRKPPEAEMTFVVRGTFQLVPNGVVTAIEGLEQGFMTAERHDGGDDERVGEILHPGDFADFKLNAEVMLRGSCHAPGNKPIKDCPVRFSVGSWKKELMVYGDRKWERAFAGTRPSEPVPFTRMPLDYAHAFGDATYEPNPVGKGRSGDALPNVEALGHLVTARGQEPPPGSFAPVSSTWPARAILRGTDYGKRWLKERAPYYASDFDWRFFSAAPPDQQLDGFLRGDEEVRLHNLHPEHANLVTRLPGLRVRAFVKDDRGAFREIAMSLDTLFAEPDKGTIQLTWRGVTPVREDDLVDVKTVLVASEPIGAPAPVDFYRAELEAFEKDPTGLLAVLPAGLREAAERHDRARRGEVLDEPKVDPSLDPISRELKKKLGPLVSPERLAEVKGAMAGLDGAPAEGKPDLEKLVAEASATNAASPPAMRVIKPGRLPDPGLRKRMREVMEQTARLREKEKQSGKKIEGLEKLDALPREPRWKELDPTYEVPGPLSTDAPGPGADLSERDFSGADLRGMDLRGANFERANLARAKLSGARLDGAKLRHAILWLADVSGANLDGADLTLANAVALRGEKASFKGAKLDEAFLEDAWLPGATLDGATLQHAILVRADLRGAKAVGADLDHADASHAKLEGADFTKAKAALALFANAQAARVDFSDAAIGQASFADADLSGARFLGAKAKKAFFLRAKLDGAELGFGDFTEAHFTEASAVGARFYGANLREARLYRTNLTRAEIVRANLASADARKATLQNTELAESNLYDAKLVDVRGTGFSLSDIQKKHLVLSQRER